MSTIGSLDVDLAQGSAAAYSAALRNDRAGADNPELDALNKQISIALKQNGNLEDISKALLNIKTPNEVNMN